MISERRILSSRVVLAIVAVAATIVAGVWIRAALQMAHAGFDITDEGNYLLSYRWWNVNHRTYTGTQYFYGPVFQMCGWSIGKLRQFRLFTIVASHALFGYAFMRWLRLRRPNAPKSTLWEVAGTAVIVATAGMQLSWLPASPSYNDIVMIGAVVATAFALRVATHVERSERVPIALLMGFGPVAVTMAFAKWPSMVTVGIPTMMVVTMFVASRGWREVLRTYAFVAAGCLVFILFLEIFVVRFERLLPEMAEVNRQIARNGNPPRALLEGYWGSVVLIYNRVLDHYELLLVAAAVAVVSRGREALLLTILLAYVAATRTATKLEASRAFFGGTSNLSNYPVTIGVFGLALLVMLVVAHVSALLNRFTRKKQPSLVRDSFRGWMVLGLIWLYPISHGFGTGNPITYMIVNAFAGWVAIMIAIATGLDGDARAGRWFGYALVAGAAYASMLITKTGILENPYRSSSFESSTAYVPGVPALRGIRVQPAAAQQWSNLRASLAPFLEPPGRAVVGYDEMAGLVFILEGRFVGESWTSRLDPLRSGEGFKASCRNGHPWWEGRRPIFLFNRSVGPYELSSFRACGIDFDTQYKLFAPPMQTGFVSVYVPVE